MPRQGSKRGWYWRDGSRPGAAWDTASGNDPNNLLCFALPVRLIADVDHALINLRRLAHAALQCLLRRLAWTQRPRRNTASLAPPRLLLPLAGARDDVAPDAY